MAYFEALIPPKIDLQCISLWDESFGQGSGDPFKAKSHKLTYNEYTSLMAYLVMAALEMLAVQGMIRQFQATKQSN